MASNTARRKPSAQTSKIRSKSGAKAKCQLLQKRANGKTQILKDTANRSYEANTLKSATDLFTKLTISAQTIYLSGTRSNFARHPVCDDFAKTVNCADAKVH